MYGCARPICCPPQYCVRDFYTTRTVPVIHPIVTINRQNIVNVPQHFIQQTTRNVTVDQGFLGQGFQGQGFQGQGFTNRLFF
jgi:Inner spore coat protein D.